MPFGLRNAPTSFQRAINIILSSVRFKSVMVYLDDFILFSINYEEHLDNLETFSSLLQNAEMTIKLINLLLHGRLNCVPWSNRQAARPSGLTQDDRLRIEDDVTGNKKKQLRSFLGLCNVYRIFFKDFESVTTRLKQTS